MELSLKDIRNSVGYIVGELIENPQLLPTQILRNYAGRWKCLDVGGFHPYDDEKIFYLKNKFIEDYRYGLERVVLSMPDLFRSFLGLKMLRELKK